jgi:hypothetical protein
MFVHSEQASPISEGVAEIRINSDLAKEITCQHDTREPHRYHEWPHFALTIKESGRVLPHPSAVFHTKTSTGSLSYPVLMPKLSTHRMYDPGSLVPHIRPKVLTDNQLS